MALNEDHWNENRKYTIWENYHQVTGTTPNNEELNYDQESLQHLKNQTALEFLISNYIDLKIQKTYGVIKLRDLLQHTKGLKYDLDFLGIKDELLTSYIDTIKEWIPNWFIHTPSDKEIILFFNKFEKVYENSLLEILKTHKLYLPSLTQYNYSKNNELLKSDKLSFSRKGFLIPNFTSTILNKKYTSIQNNLNKFSFQIPFETMNVPKILDERIKFFSKMKQYNVDHYPNFASLITGLISKLV